MQKHNMEKNLQGEIHFRPPSDLEMTVNRGRCQDLSIYYERLPRY